MNKLKIWRAFANVTQKELGAMLGVSGEMVYQWERGIRSINPQRVAEIRKLLKVPKRFL
jgi:transcriptional regulator with XRE-family HTH domain